MALIHSAFLASACRSLSASSFACLASAFRISLCTALSHSFTSLGFSVIFSSISARDDASFKPLRGRKKQLLEVHLTHLEEKEKLRASLQLFQFVVTDNQWDSRTASELSEAEIHRPPSRIQSPAWTRFTNSLFLYPSTLRSNSLEKENEPRHTYGRR
jgi:hypothetical protein